MLAITQYSTVFSQNLVYFGRKKIALGGIISRCMSGGCPRVLFLRYDDACTGFASCSYPRTASGHHGVGQCDPQLLLWYSVPASCTPHIAGGSEGTFCLPSASGCHSRALRPAVLPPGERLVLFTKLCPRLNQFWTAGMSTRNSWSLRHSHHLRSQKINPYYLVNRAGFGYNISG